MIRVKSNSLSLICDSILKIASFIRNKNFLKITKLPIIKNKPIFGHYMRNSPRLTTTSLSSLKNTLIREALLQASFSEHIYSLTLIDLSLVRTLSSTLLITTLNNQYIILVFNSSCQGKKKKRILMPSANSILTIKTKRVKL